MIAHDNEGALVELDVFDAADLEIHLSLAQEFSRPTTQSSISVLYRERPPARLEHCWDTDCESFPDYFDEKTNRERHRIDCCLLPFCWLVSSRVIQPETAFIRLIAERLQINALRVAVEIQKRLGASAQ